ncbi:MAG: glycosyltransferase family 2 protein [Lachnospiraceae bacterium]|nr:glycosyltransferase family 2 protein [Lachnospiraceae bacterium]
MDNNIEFSVIVMNYNSSYDQIRKTIDSVLFQERVNFEIIVCDDCSKDNHFGEIDAYLKDKGVDYKLLGTEVNLGTVKNLLRGLREAKGYYTKHIGAGDMLYAPNTLRSVKNFMERTECDYCFGAMQGYRKTMDGYESISQYFPRDIVAYRNRDERRIYRNLMVSEDWVSGVSLFSKTEFIYKYMTMLNGRVIYCEDWFTGLAAVDHNLPLYINRYVTLYEIGEGISTGVNPEFKKKINEDNRNFWKLFDEYCRDRQAKEFYKHIAKRRIKKKFEFLKSEKAKIAYKSIVAPDLVLFEANVALQKKKGYHIPPVKPKKNMIELIDK